MPVKDPAGLARLQAYADGGKAGLDAWNAAQAQAAQAQQSALSSASGLARNGPAEVAALGKIVSDYTSPVIGAAQSGAAYAPTEAAYFSRAGQSELSRAMAELDTERKQKDQKRQLDRELAQQDYQFGMQKLSLDREEALAKQNAMSASEINDAVMGAAPMLQQADRQAAQQAISDAQQRFVNDENAKAELEVLRRSVDNLGTGNAVGGEQERITKLAQKYGLDPAALTVNPQAPRLSGTANLDGGSQPHRDMEIPRDAARLALGAQGAVPAPAPQQPPDLYGLSAERRAQTRALDELLANATKSAGESGGVVNRGVEALGLVNDPTSTTLGEGLRYRSIDEDLGRYAREAAIAGGINPLVANGMFPSTPEAIFKQRQELDKRDQYEAQQDYKALGQEANEAGRERKVEINTAAEELGMDPGRFGEIVNGSNLPPAKAKTVLGDSESMSELQARVDQAIGEGKDYTEFMSEVRADLNAKKNAGEMPEDMSVTDYLNFIGFMYRPQFTQVGLTGS